MASIDNRPLKAFVRFDGTGRIVPSSLILRRKKPKVGKWVEIPAYECCNTVPTSSTTTTTTTAAPLYIDISTAGNCGELFTSAYVTMSDSFCGSPTLTAVIGSFFGLPEIFYVIYGGFSRPFLKIDNFTAQYIGGAPNECVDCSTTTTTTTTAVPPTEYTRSYWTSVFNSCNTTTEGTFVFYSASPTLSLGVAIFQNAGLTIPVTEGYVISEGMSVFAVGANGVLIERVCP